MTQLNDVLDASAVQGDEVMHVEHAVDGDIDLPSSAIVLAIHDTEGKCLVVRCQIGAEGRGVSFIDTGYIDGEPVDLSPFLFADKVNLAL